jgi:formamidopyrimidine-DNA glycosylase
MPEIPDLTAYVEALNERVLGQPLVAVQISNPFILRTVAPAVDELEGRRVTAVHRLAKRVVIGLEEDRYIAIHLMIAGRLHWARAGVTRATLIAFNFASGQLTLTEAGRHRRAAVHLISGAANLRQLDPGGQDPLHVSLDQFVLALTRENHTLKRALTDQRFISGIGNAYSDEILHQARLSPLRQTRQLDDSQWERLYHATRDVLGLWISRLRSQRGGKFPEKVTAFHPDMAVHGKYRQPCPACDHPVQRIRYATNECNYCAACQNQGRLLADRAMSRLLKKDWPKTLEDLDPL